MSISSLKAAYTLCRLSDFTLTLQEVDRLLYRAHCLYAQQIQGALILDPIEIHGLLPRFSRLYKFFKECGVKSYHLIPRYCFHSDLEIAKDKEYSVLKYIWDEEGHLPPSFIRDLITCEDGPLSKALKNKEPYIIFSYFM